MSRSNSGRVQRPRPLSAGKPQNTTADKATYEDLLVAQYLDELRKSPQYGKHP